MSNPAVSIDRAEAAATPRQDHVRTLRLAAWSFAAWAVLFYVAVWQIEVPFAGTVTLPGIGRLDGTSLVEQVDETQSELRLIPHLKYDDRVDFAYFYAAAGLVWHGDLSDVYPHLYEYIYFPGVGDPAFQMVSDERVRDRLLTRGNYYNPPIIAILQAPLASLPFKEAFWTFSAFSAAAFGGFLYLFWRAGKGIPEVPLIILGMAGFRPVHEALIMAHLSLFFVLALGAGFLALRAKQPYVAGLMLSLLALKPQWAILPALFLVVRGEWRAAATMAVAGSLLFLLPFLPAGMDTLRDYRSFLLEQSKNDLWNAPHMFSWNGFLSKHVANDPLAIEPDVDKTLMYILQAGTLAAVLVVWLGRDLYLGVAATIIGMLLGVIIPSPMGTHVLGGVPFIGELPVILVSVHSVWYDWAFLVVAAAFLVLRPGTLGTRAQVWVLLLVLFITADQSVSAVFEPDGRHGWLHWTEGATFSVTIAAAATLLWCALRTVLDHRIKLAGLHRGLSRMPVTSTA